MRLAAAPLPVFDRIHVLRDGVAHAERQIEAVLADLMADQSTHGSRCVLIEIVVRVSRDEAFFEPCVQFGIYLALMLHHRGDFRCGNDLAERGRQTQRVVGFHRKVGSVLAQQPDRDDLADLAVVQPARGALQQAAVGLHPADVLAEIGVDRLAFVCLFTHRRGPLRYSFELSRQSSAVHDRAAIDADRLAVDPLRFVRKQEADETGDVLHGAEARALDRL